MPTNISWADESWNPFVGCRPVSPACVNCYAQDMAARIVRMEAGLGRLSHYALTVRPTSKGAAWTGHIARAPHKARFAPFGLKRPRDIFVCSMSDFFHAGAADDWRIEALAIMALTPRHQYLVLTKRDLDMRRFMSAPETARAVWDKAAKLAIERNLCFARIEEMLVGGWPLPNVALGVTVEDQARADERILELLETPAAKRFVSVEPMLGSVNLGWAIGHPMEIAAGYLARGCFAPGLETIRRIDWIICGGESGPNARPMHPDWARDLRDQCSAAGVPFFFKQWGEWAPGEAIDDPQDRTTTGAWHFAGQWRQRPVTVRESEEMHFDDEPDVWRVGKRRAGRLLDGVEHHARPFSRSIPAATAEPKETVAHA